MMKVFGTFGVTFLAVALMGVQASGAIAFDLNLQKASSGGARFSFLHTASGSGTGKAASGDTVQIGTDGTVGPSNILNGMYDTSTEILTITGTDPSPIAHAALIRGTTTVIEPNSFQITGGMFLVTDITGGGSGAFGGGYLSYKILDGIDPSIILNSGNFYFASKNEGSGPPDGTTPNSGVFDESDPLLSTIAIAEWGNNWTYSGTDWSFLKDKLGLDLGPTGLDEDHAFDSTYRLGMDLLASGSATPNTPTGFDTVPEPMSAVVWVGLGLCFSMIGSRRRRRAGSSRA